MTPLIPPGDSERGGRPATGPETPPSRAENALRTIIRSQTLPTVHWDKLEHLANSNTGGNRSAMYGLLGAMAMANWEALGLRQPSYGGTGEAGWIDYKRMESGRVERRNISLPWDTWQMLKAVANSNTAGRTSTLMRYVIDKGYKNPALFSIRPPTKLSVAEQIAKFA